MLSYHTCPLATLGGKDTGGMNVYVRELTRHLGQLGVHVDVFTRSQDDHVPHISHDLGYGNRVVHIPAGPETWLPKQDIAGYLPLFAQGVLNFGSEKKIQYDLIHSHYWMSGIAAQQLKAVWNVPIVHMFHTLGHMKNRVARNEMEKEGAYRLDGEQMVIKSADCIIAATPAEQSQLAFLYRADTRKVKIIPPGVDVHHFYPIPSDEAKEVVGVPVENCMLLFVGRIEPLKGVDTLIQAMALLRARGELTHCPYYLAVIGGDPAMPIQSMNHEMVRLQKLCEELNLSEVVLFLGKRSQDSLPYYYSAAEVLIMPSQYESFGMVALEAMACGTPVVASQVGGLAFLVKDGVTGFVIPDSDPEKLAGALRKLISDSGLRQRMGEQAALLAKDYAWEIIGEQVITIYQHVLANPDQVHRRGKQPYRRNVL